MPGWPKDGVQNTMNTYQNLTGGCSVLLEANESHASIPQPIADVLAKARINKITVEYAATDGSGEVYTVIQKAEVIEPQVAVATIKAA